jgi:hypothetical protein
MKALKFIVIGLMLFLASTVQAQVVVSANFGSPPPWGPAGYNEVRYYYLPDVEAYYDVKSSKFIYYSGGKWVHRKYLPTQYRSYDLYGGYKVVMTDYRGNTPYTYFTEYKTKYARGYSGQAQKTIGERPGKGNSGAKMKYKGYSNKEVKQNNGKSVGNKNMKKDTGKSGGKGKKK